MINENKFLGTGWSFPPEFSNGGARVHTVSGEEDIQQSLHLLLTTSVKERIMQSNYGCDLKNYVFENISQALNNDIKSTISDAILNHESRVALEDVILENLDTASGHIKIQVQYKIRMTNTRFNYVFPFYLNEVFD